MYEEFSQNKRRQTAAKVRKHVKKSSRQIMVVSAAVAIAMLCILNVSMSGEAGVMAEHNWQFAYLNKDTSTVPLPIIR
ncbi:hypothetical protein [Sneathiella sp.]|uniref:hypothetical protein n=1 Tax=Sneathiella sp. TaxID=1964365 RepID=UPI003568A62F